MQIKSLTYLNWRFICFRIIYDYLNHFSLPPPPFSLTACVLRALSFCTLNFEYKITMRLRPSNAVHVLKSYSCVKAESENKKLSPTIDCILYTIHIFINWQANIKLAAWYGGKHVGDHDCFPQNVYVRCIYLYILCERINCSFFLSFHFFFFVFFRSPKHGVSRMHITPLINRVVYVCAVLRHPSTYVIAVHGDAKKS